MSVSKENSVDNPQMAAKDVIDFLALFENENIKIIVDGGWCVDALLGKELRSHNDLDIAIEWKYVPRLRQILSAQGFKQIKEDNQWNFVLADGRGHEIDVHAFIYDNNGNVIDGIMYPAASLTGKGIIGGKNINCITPEYMVEFLAPWISKWPDKYLSAVAGLCQKFNVDLPKEYQKYILLKGENDTVEFIETSKVVEGVECDVYKFINDNRRDLGIIRLRPGCKTPRQTVLKGDKTIEGYISGSGRLAVGDNGETKEYIAQKGLEVEVKIGQTMQWIAADDSELAAYEICYPPYEAGRFKNLS